MEPIRCPKCGAIVTIEYVNTGGPHWTCAKCGRNSHSYTIVYDNRTKKSKETETHKTTGGIIV